MSSRVQLIAHRGASAYALENTLEAFELARAQEADAIEFDVQLTRDENLVVFHDADLQRLASDAQLVRSMTRAAILRVPLVLGSKTGRAPMLADVFAWAAHNDMRLHVELKLERTRDALPIAKELSRAFRGATASVRARTCVSSFAPSVLVGLAALEPSLARAFLFDREHTGLFASRALAQILPLTFVHPNYKLCSPRRMARWRARGLGVNAWTVDSPGVASALARVGVDGIITNDVPKLRTHLFL